MDYKNFKTKFLTPNYKRIIAVDIGTDTVKIAAVNCAKTVPQVEKLILEQLPLELQADGYLFNAKAMADFLASIFKRDKIKGKALAFTVGTDKTVLLNLQLPYLPKQELKEAAKWEIAHVTNSSTDSFCHSAFYLTHNTGGLNDVIAIVMPDTAVKVFAAIAEQLDLPLAGVFLRSTAVEQTLTKDFKNFILCENTADDEYTLTAFSNSLPVLQKSVSGGADVLAFEIENTVASLPNDEINQIILTGIDFVLADKLQERISMQVTANGLGHSLGFAETIAADVLGKLEGFAAVTGAALAAANNSPFNLFSAPKAGFNLPRWKIYRAAAVCAVVCAFGIWGWQLAELFQLQQQLKEADKQISSAAIWQQRYEESAAVNAQLNRRFKLAENIKAQNIDWNSALTDISSAVPVGCWIERIEQGNTKQLNVTGYAVNIDKAVEFSQQLAKQQANAKAEFAELKNTQLDGRNVTAFNLLLERK